MGKMINVKVVSDCGGEMPLLPPLLQAEKEPLEKKCSLVQVKRKRQNITKMGRCNSSNKTSSYIKTTSSPVPIITEASRLNSSNPKRTKKFSRLSSPHPPPPPLLPQLNHFIEEEDGAEESNSAAPHSVITSIKRGITSCRNSGSRTFNNCSSFNTSNTTTTLSSSSSPYLMTVAVSLTKGLVTSAAAAVHVLFIPFLLFIVTMPVSGLATDMLPKTPSSHLSLTSSSSPSFYTSSSPFSSSSLLSSSSSTVKSTVVSSSLYGTRPIENHHYHPLSILSSSSSSSSSSHLLEDSPHLADQPANDKQQQVPASGQQQPHTCYVCLPPDKTSRGAEEILSIFPEETRKHIPDCASFGSQTAKHFEFKCPPEYVGCLLRIHGKNESRSCGRLPLNDCKTANSVELCYCTGALCNGNRPEILLEETESDERLRTQLEDEKEERETRKIWQKGETDDEDLLGPQQHTDIDGMQDDTGDYGSGSEPPPGVIPHYTSTPKPTLIPNIRPDTRTTTPASTSGAPASTSTRSIKALFRLRVPFTIISVTTPNFASLVPLLLPVVLIQKMWDLTSLQLNL